MTLQIIVANILESMKFSIKVQYGLQALLELALNFGGGNVLIKDIASSQKVPIRFLEQLLLLLKRGGLAESARGKSGGYVLAKHPSDITLLDVIEILDGPVELAGKKMKKSPVIFEVFEKLEEKTKKELTGITLEDMIFSKRQKDRAINYSI